MAEDGTGDAELEVWQNISGEKWLRWGAGLGVIEEGSCEISILYCRSSELSYKLVTWESPFFSSVVWTSVIYCILRWFGEGVSDCKAEGADSLCWNLTKDRHDKKHLTSLIWAFALKICCKRLSKCILHYVLSAEITRICNSWFFVISFPSFIVISRLPLYSFRFRISSRNSSAT